MTAMSLPRASVSIPPHPFPRTFQAERDEVVIPRPSVVQADRMGGAGAAPDTVAAAAVGAVLAAPHLGRVGPSLPGGGVDGGGDGRRVRRVGGGGEG